MGELSCLPYYACMCALTLTPELHLLWLHLLWPSCAYYFLAFGSCAWEKRSEKWIPTPSERGGVTCGFSFSRKVWHNLEGTEHIHRTEPCLFVRGCFQSTERPRELASTRLALQLIHKLQQWCSWVDARCEHSTVQTWPWLYPRATCSSPSARGGFGRVLSLHF